MFTRLTFDRPDPNDDDGLRRWQADHCSGSRRVGVAADRLLRTDFSAGGGIAGPHTRWNETMLEELLCQVSLPEGLLARLRQAVDEWAD